MLDYRKSSRFAYPRLQKLGSGNPAHDLVRLGRVPRAPGFLVGGLIGLLIWLAGWIGYATVRRRQILLH